MDLYTLDNDDATIAQVMDVLNLGLPIAEGAEVISPENISALRAWIRAERFRLREEPAPTRPLDNLRSSQWFGFWNTLEADQEVRWTKAKAATYFIVNGDLAKTSPDRYARGEGPWVELRRHTGKTFWAHIVTVRPLSNHAALSDLPWRELTDAEEAAEERTWD